MNKVKTFFNRLIRFYYCATKAVGGEYEFYCPMLYFQFMGFLFYAWIHLFNIYISGALVLIGFFVYTRLIIKYINRHKKEYEKCYASLSRKQRVIYVIIFAGVALSMMIIGVNLLGDYAAEHC